MPLYYMRKIWTPAQLVGIKFFKSEDGHLFIKIGSKVRRRIR